jgi:ABC-2 type transport system ATP-binding protein
MWVDVNSHVARECVGYLPENPAFYDYLNAVEYLALVGNVFKMLRTEIEKVSERILKLFELWEARKRPIRSYSKGMVQRLGLAQVMLHDPTVYILDEPMSGLDPIGRALVKDIIKDLKAQGKCVFFSTHITADVETICDRVGVIVKGKLHRVENVQTILDEGLAGYTIRLKKGESGIEDVYIHKTDLANFIEKQRADGNEIVLLEPARKNLEEFFLDIVKGTAC